MDKKVVLNTNNEMEKKLKILLFMFVAILFVACSSDDESDGGSGNGGGVKTCYFEAEGQRYNYKYAFYTEYAAEDGDAPGTGMVFADIDLLYYYNNMDKIEDGMTINEAIIVITHDSDYKNIPAGKYESMVDGTDQEDLMKFSCVVIPGVRLMDYKENGYFDLDDYGFYSQDNSHSYLNISKSGNCYTMNISPLNLEWENSSSKENKTLTDKIGKFYFEGSFTDISFSSARDDTRSMKIQKVDDAGFWKFINRLNNHKE